MNISHINIPILFYGSCIDPWVCHCINAVSVFGKLWHVLMQLRRSSAKAGFEFPIFSARINERATYVDSTSNCSSYFRLKHSTFDLLSHNSKRSLSPYLVIARHNYYSMIALTAGYLSVSLTQWCQERIHKRLLSQPKACQEKSNIFYLVLLSTRRYSITCSSVVTNAPLCRSTINQWCHAPSDERHFYWW